MRRIVFLLLSAALLAAPASAQSKKELAAQDQLLAQRLLVLEKRMLTGDPAAERLMSRMDSLEGSQRKLTGEVERLNFERNKLRAEIAAFNEDIEDLRASLAILQALADRTKIHLDAVDLVAQQNGAPHPSGPVIYGGSPAVTPQGLAGAPQGSHPSGVPAGQPSAISGPPATRSITIPVQENYNALSGLPNTGKQKLAEGDFAGAQSDFSRYLAGMPDAADTAEIQFWLGETYYVRQGYADAADAYIASMRKAPNGQKAPDAMVRLAAALRGLGKREEACRTLDSFLSQYPNAPAGVRARHQTELSRAGC